MSSHPAYYPIRVTLHKLLNQASPAIKDWECQLAWIVILISNSTFK